MYLSRALANRLRAALVVTAILALSSCSDPLGADGQLRVDKAVDTFLFQALNLEEGNQTISYPWENTGTQASIDVSNGLSTGSAILTIEDADGAVVHQDDVASDNDTDTAVGTSGRWRIEIDIQNASGSFTISVETKS